MNARFGLIICAAALVGGCSGSSAQIPIVAQPSLVERAATQNVIAGGHLYVARKGGITVFDAADGKIARTIDTSPQNPGSIVVDGRGNIYVSEQGSVAVYGPSGDRPMRKITNGISHPFGLAIDRDGNLYVSNTHLRYSTVTGGSVTVYAPGSRTPKRIMTDLLNGLGGPIAVSSTGYVYVVNTTQDENHANVVVFGPAGDRALRTITGFAYMLALDAGGRLFVTHTNAGANQRGSVDVYSPNGAAAHVQTIVQGVNGPLQVAIDRENVWITMGNSQSVNDYSLSGLLLRSNSVKSYLNITAAPHDALFVASYPTQTRHSIRAFVGSTLEYTIKNVRPFWMAYGP